MFKLKTSYKEKKRKKKHFIGLLIEMIEKKSYCRLKIPLFNNNTTYEISRNKSIAKSSSWKSIFEVLAIRREVTFYNRFEMVVIAWVYYGIPKPNNCWYYLTWW